MDYLAYLPMCEQLGLKPCDSVTFAIAMEFAGDHEIPFVTSRGTIWMRHVRKKTRNERPLQVAAAKALAEQ